MHNENRRRPVSAVTRMLLAPGSARPVWAMVFFFAAGFLAFAANANAELNIMPVSEVREGMTGHGRTVFHGSAITEFPVTVRGVMPGAGLSGEPLILVELTGGEVEKYGGVSQGMSGSPIFIDGKLIGALSLTFPFTDHSLGGVTPIETMIAAADYEEDPVGMAPGETTPLGTPVSIGGRTYSSIRIGGDAPGAEGVLVARTAVAPVMVQGISPRVFKYVEKLFRESGADIRPVTGPLGRGMRKHDQEIKPGSALKPGSSVAVQLVTGDVEMSGVGTLTAVDGSRVWMFGHPFFRKGKVNYLLADAEVLAIVQGDDMPFKVTNSGALRGSVTQDRGSALVGRLDVYPALIPLEITSIDRDIGREKITRVKIVNDEDILPNLVLMVLLETLDNTIDKIGGGTANIRFSLKITGRDEEIAWENMHYDRYDIASRSLSDLVDLLSVLNENRFYDSVVSGMKVLVEIDSSRSSAMIEKVSLSGRQKSELTSAPATEPDKGSGKAAGAFVGGKAKSADAAEEAAGEETSDEDGILNPFEDTDATGDNKIPVVYPGDRLELSVQIRPFRGETVEERLFLKVPHDIAYGKAVIDVFSGTRDMPVMSPGGFIIDVKVEGPEEREQAEEMLTQDEDGEESFDELLRDFMERDQNNELAATIESMAFGATDISDDEDSSQEEEDDQDKPEYKAKKKTGWVLNGSASIKVRVANPSGEEDSFKTRTIIKSSINALKK